ncbi:hypothetical protein AWB78_08624 [Caballeronia calidae]|uniref:Uncharacterized protein n=1 Tax=Caballeronia calidae TaxID=1777139 RepID=A0A158EKX9_9BURK|nr:hypothetical protein [Caballeronia calidae]SAL07542.1 hypothetical protein AWB78_08624 [Caballeronia calidae]
MDVIDALVLVDSFRTRFGDPAQAEIDFKTKTVMMLIHVLERNLDADFELRHGLTFARAIAASHRPHLALARLRSTLLRVGADMPPT